MNILTKIHAAEDEYPEDLLEDPKVSWNAKGLYMCLSAMPDGCPVRLSDLTERGCDGIDAVRRGLLDLRLFGYLRKTSVHRYGRRRSHLLMASVPLFGVDPLAMAELFRDRGRRNPRYGRLRQIVCANFGNILRESRTFRALFPAAAGRMEGYGVPAYDSEYSPEMLQWVESAQRLLADQ